MPCIEGLSGLVEADVVLQKMAINDYRKTVEGKYEGVFASLAQAVNIVHQRVTHLVSTMKDISKGDLEELPEYKKIMRRSEGDELVPAIIGMMESVNAARNGRRDADCRRNRRQIRYPSR